jgi:hypothetical protein
VANTAKEEGMIKGRELEKNDIIIQAFKRGNSPIQISAFLSISIEEVEQIIADYQNKMKD